jgi:hypothetical protein
VLSCLSLLNRTHVRVAHEGGLQRTACGLSVADEFVTPGLFADTATCEGCRHAARIEVLPVEPAADPKALARQLFDHVLNPNEPGRLGALLGDGLAATFPPHRVSRLHDLFPTWHATIVDLIAEGERVVLRYRVEFTDPFGLADTTRRTNTVILRTAGRRIVHAEPVVDDFALWPEIPAKETAK